MVSRRDFLGRMAHGAIPLVLVGSARQDGQVPLARPQTKPQGAKADTLAVAPGGTVAAMGPLDNDPVVIGIERRLGCACGCTLDVYTCRTTDFACTISPAMHAKVVEQIQRDATPQEIIDWFLAQPDSTFGHRVLLMAPEARGFNLMGYIVPGLTVTAFGLALAGWLLRKRSEPELQVIGATATPPPDQEQLEKLRRALEGIES